MEKNTIVAVLLCIGFMALWYTVVMPKKAQQAAPVQAPASSIVKQDQAPVVKPVDSAVNDGSFELYTLENESLTLSISQNGGSIANYIIKERQSPLELVPVGPLFFGTYTGVKFVKKSQEKLEKEGSSYTCISLIGRLASGLDMEKRYYIADKGFLHKIELVISNKTKRPAQISDLSFNVGPGVGGGARDAKENMTDSRAIGYKDFTVTNFKNGDYSADYNWSGVDNRYFLAALLPGKDSSLSSIRVIKEKKKLPEMEYKFSDKTLSPQETISYEVPFYFGPKSYLDLKKLGYKLEESVDFGFFGVLGKVALKALQYLKKLTGNYGFAIIILTVILQLLMYPLTAKSFQASLAMKKLQPQLKLIQEKYKDDPKRLNVETMNLYKSSGTNPFGGCLPMILQIPIFWAFFTTLRNAFELRHAPFIFWIKDLSMPDKFYVLPILMGLGMFLQQKMMSVSADPMQEKMAYIMPVILTVLFINFPAGLVLYWLTNNIVTGIEQFIMLRAQENAKK